MLTNGVAVPLACATKSKQYAASTTHNMYCKSTWKAIQSNRYHFGIRMMFNNSNDASVILTHCVNVC
jgi:hypothetical protein